MSKSRFLESESYSPPFSDRVKRWMILIGVPLIVLVVLGIILFNVCFHYVPPNHMLVVVTKYGDPLESGQILANPGQKGIQEEVLGEGYHFVMPILKTAMVEKNTIIEPGKVGIVVNKGGRLPEGDWVLVDGADVKGIRREVLLPGSYRINPYGYEIKIIDAVEIKAGYVGVVHRLRVAEPGKPTAFGEMFGDDPGQIGVLGKAVLQPGTYYVNKEEYDVIPREVGIYQTSYQYYTNPEQSTAIEFTVKDGYIINMDCTVEWELLPENAPKLVEKYPTIRDIEKMVIDQQARRISRERGFNYGAQDWLDGIKREEFQEDFKMELIRACGENNVKVKSAFIRNIIIPDSFLKPKRDKQLADETRTTNLAKEETARSDAAVERERSLIDQEVKKIEAETLQMVALIEQDIENLTAQTDAEITKMKNEYDAKIADIEAERKRVTAQAESEATKLKETAKNSLYRMKMDVFQSNPDAFLRYTMAQQINPNLMLRVFHAGPGTLWTNLGNKNMTFMLPAPGASVPTSPTTTTTTGNGVSEK